MPFMIFAPCDDLQVRYQNVFVTKMFLLPVATRGRDNAAARRRCKVASRSNSSTLQQGRDDKLTHSCQSVRAWRRRRPKFR